MLKYMHHTCAFTQAYMHTAYIYIYIYIYIYKHTHKHT